jgi:uncharacterized membrane protein YkvA (DUF1232 family)
MIKDKRYTIPFTRKLVYIALIVYIVIPFDFIPGVIPIVGMVDDLGAFAVIIGVLLYEITTYRDFLEGSAKRGESPAKNGKKQTDTNAASEIKTKNK